MVEQRSKHNSEVFFFPAAAAGLGLFQDELSTQKTFSLLHHLFPADEEKHGWFRSVFLTCLLIFFLIFFFSIVSVSQGGADLLFCRECR